MKIGAASSLLNRLKGVQFNQEKIVFAITIVLFATFCLTLDQFATPGNLISLFQSVAILGVLGNWYGSGRDWPRDRSHHGHDHGDLRGLGVQ